MSACKCLRCRTTDQPAEAPVVHEPVTLPDQPRPFRVHHPEGRTQDCTLHPDGHLTTVMAGQQWVSALDFDEMRATSWERAHIEWDPAPLLDPAPTPEPEPVQAALIPAV
ncbi:hypothetical protein [Streptomyces sp. NPDC058872]|uniref:hypothetical protein n=1 Tax=Streptomyces sp. NPDC058872 TaxID=3346661 RepID=UPI0036909D5F